MNQEEFGLMRAVEDDHWWFCARRDVLSRLIGRVVISPANILELGCGTGGNFRLWQQFGKVSAIEPNATARSFARERGGASVFAGTLPDQLPAEITGQTFDMVVALDVLEHLDQDQEAARVSYRLLRKGGYALFTVPAYRFLWSRHDEKLEHKRRYRREALVHLVHVAGYRVIYASYFNTVLFPLMLVARLAAALFGDSVPRGDRIPPPFLNSAFRAMFGLEGYALRHFLRLPFGGSVVVLARRVD